jgi:Domain of Unknown Function (DUF1206)
VTTRQRSGASGGDTNSTGRDASQRIGRAAEDAAEDAGDAVEHAAEHAADAAVHGGGDAPSRAVELLGRVGLVAYGVVHLLIAGLGLRLALGSDAAEVDQRGAVGAVASFGVAGRVVLAAVVVGLLAFAVWQLCAAAVGFRWVSGGERMRKRVGAVAKTIAVLAIALVAGRFALGMPSSTGGSLNQWLVASALSLPAGRAITALAAVVVLVIAGTMVYTAVSRSFLGDLVEDLPHHVRRAAAVLGAAGNLARAVAFGAVGVLIGLAALQRDPTRAGGLDQALRFLTGAWQGIAPLVAVALGFAAFGVYCFVDAWWRRA